ncbi:MAG: hypothetical protein WEA58_14740, partial [Balneolaceae bacterium]
FILHKKIGDSVKENETLATLHTNNSGMLTSAKEGMDKAFTISESNPPLQKQIAYKVDKKGVHKYDG